MLMMIIIILQPLLAPVVGPRMLIGQAVFAARLGPRIGSHHAFQYWELFFLKDLLLVAGGGVRDGYISRQFDLVRICGICRLLHRSRKWLVAVYASNYVPLSRPFPGAFHGALFLHIIGFGLAIVNHVGYDKKNSFKAFCWCAILQRVNVLVMIVQISASLP
jgi:hypothetical protein